MFYRNDMHCGNQSFSSALGITAPSPCQSLDFLATISGTGQPGADILIKIDNQTPLLTTVDTAGNWSSPNPYSLTAGTHTIFVTSTYCGRCQTQCVHFCIAPVDDEIPPIPD